MANPDLSAPHRHRWLVLGLFIVIVLGIGFGIGFTIQPGAWYETLAKPSFTPPNSVFGPVWTLVYLLIAVAGWRIWESTGMASPAGLLWILQLLLNWAWTPTFFAAHAIGPGLAVIGLLFVVILAFLAMARDRLACWCFLPYLAWIGYATTLNFAIWRLN